MKIVQKIFLSVSFCLILYIVLHSGIVWTVFKLLSSCQNRTVNSGSLIFAIISKLNHTQSAASFSKTEHNDRTYSGEGSQLQITCGA